MQLIKVVRPIDRARSWQPHCSGCSRVLCGPARHGNNSDCFLVPFLFPERHLTCGLLLETLCVLLRGLEILRRARYWYSMAILLGSSYPPQLGSDFALSSAPINLISWIP